MLLLDSLTTAAGLTVYADHLDPALFHYVPAAPRIVSRPDAPGLQLLKYRGAQQGGLLTLDVDLAVDRGVLTAAKAELTRRATRPVDLVPVLFRHGSVRLTTLGVESAVPAAPADAGSAAAAVASSFLVERILATTTPSLMGHARAVFSVRLKPEGVQAIEHALRGDVMPTVVAYDLTFEGLRQARGIRATVHYRMAYDYLRARLVPNMLLFKADLDREAEALQREGHITIEDVDYVGTDPAVRAQRLDEVRRTLRELAETLFFRPATSPATMGTAVTSDARVASEWARGAQAQAVFCLRALNQQESATLEYNYDEARVREWNIAPQGALRAPAGVELEDVVRDVTLTSEPTSTDVRVFALPDADWSGIEAITVDLRAGTSTASCVLTPTALDHHATLAAGSDVEARVTVLAADDPEAIGSPPAEPSGFEPVNGTILYIEPAAVARRRVVSLTLGVQDPAMEMRVQGRLSGQHAQREFLLDAARPQQQVAVWGQAVLHADWTSHFAAATNGIPAQRDVAAGETIVVFNPPADRYQVVAVMLNDPLERFTTVFVELEDGDGRRRAVQLDERSPRAEWSRVRQADAQPYRYRIRSVQRDGRVIEEPWRNEVSSLLLVGDTDTRVEKIQVILVGMPASLGGMFQVTSLAPPDGAQGSAEVMLDADQTQFEVRLPFRETEPTKYRIEGQLFLESGERTVGPIEEQAEVLLLDVSAR